jgi:glucose-6-phosphate-specific signal transduction histidine kinase
MLTANAFTLYWFVMCPAVLLCWQYGWDMTMRELTPTAQEID